MPASPKPARSVFLSYAREDAEPARRIADALRGFGIEVWFDQSELRGGDAWDAKIKRQIRDCTLFIALVSATSQARGEGYFRREWKLAIERTHDMAAGIPFLLPVVIDGTPEAQAIVPEEFMRVQWTRLPDGVPTPQFVERISRLLENPQAAAAETPPLRPGAAVPAGRPGKAGVPGWVWGLVGGVVIAAAAVGILARKPVPAAPLPMPVPSAPPARVIDEKSIAVLPFANMSDDKENAYFTEGIQEDVLTNLALAHELRVVSRTSVMQYRDTTKPIRQIAAELGVAYVLEGSVRREGNKVRVTGQLIHAASDEHVWAKAYDRDLTDIFAIQSELAQAIAAELKTALSPEEKVRLERRPTENPQAYDLYLQARRLDRERDEEKILQLLRQAVGLDPSFARAWSDLADEYAYRLFQFTGSMEDNRVQAQVAIDRATKIAPDDPEVIQSLGTYYYYGFRDYARANEIYQKLLAQRPNDAGVFNSLGLIQRRQGQWKEALASFRRSTELDQANPVFLKNLISCLVEARRYAELAPAWRKMAALRPEDAAMCEFQVALMAFMATGSRRELEAYLAHLSPETLASPEGLQMRFIWLGTISDYPGLERLLRASPSFHQDGLSLWEQNILNAHFYWKIGKQAEAVRSLGTAWEESQAKVALEPQNPRLLYWRAQVEMVLGKRAEALADTERSMTLMPVSLDAVDGGLYDALNTASLDDLGETEKALAGYARCLLEPGGADFLNTNAMKADSLSNLRSDPRYQALLNDPKNNAPLF